MADESTFLEGAGGSSEPAASPPAEGQVPQTTAPQQTFLEPSQGGAPAPAQETSGPPPGHPRWRDVYSKMKGAERRADEAEAKLESLIARQVQQPPSYSHERLPLGSPQTPANRMIDGEISRVSMELEATQDPAERSVLRENLGSLTARRELENYTAQQDQRIHESAFQQDEIRYTSEAVQLVQSLTPEMQGPVLKAAEELYNQDPHWPLSARGRLDAVVHALLYAGQGRMTQLQTAEQQVKMGAGLERSTPVMGETGASQAKSDLDEALRTPSSRGRTDKFAEYLAKHVTFPER